jgi:hypothetical protein
MVERWRILRAVGEGRSSGAPSPTQLRSLACPEPPLVALASGSLVAREIPFFAEADLEEHEQQGAAQARRDQNDREDFARHAADECRADTPGDDERRERTKRGDPGSSGHLRRKQPPRGQAARGA